MKLLMIVAISSVVLVSCSEDEQVVESQISASGEQVQCPSADARSTFEDNPPDCEVYSCRWFCVTYEGKAEQYVDRQYRRCSNTKWRFEAEYVRDAASNDCSTMD